MTAFNMLTSYEKRMGKNFMKTCYFCKGKINPQKIQHIHQWQGKIYLFKNVKAEVCDQCGEVFLLPESLRYIDERLRMPEKAEKEIKVPVYSVPNSPL
jgi:YgiT-type zinc finger domain-containing protein